MTRTRFAPWLVFACIGTLVGCTSGDQGTAGNSQLNVVIPSGSSTSGPGAPSSFDIEVVEYTINCTGADFDPTVDPDIDSGPTLDQDVSFSGALEVLDTASGGVDTQDFGPDLTEVYVWQGFMDIPADHACTVQLRARDDDGEVICTATEGFNVGADATVKVNVLMICDISYQAPVGMVDLDGDFSFIIGNYCPDLFVLNCVDPDLEDLLVVPGLGAFVYSGCQVRFRDADSQCGASCDPQDCSDVTPAGINCIPGPDPGEPTTTVTCESPGFFCAIPGPLFGTPCTPAAGDTCFDASAGTACAPGSVLNCGGAAAPTLDPFCVYDGDTLGSPGDAPPNPLAPGVGGFLVGCTVADDDGDPATPPVALAPGAEIVCTANTTDGDADCNKQKTVSVFCPGLTPCQAAGPGFCDDGNDCTSNVCDDSSGSAVCSNPSLADGTSCTSAPAPATCQAGVCTSQNCNAQTNPDGSCDDSNECTTNACQPDGSCSSTPNTGDDCAGGTGSCNAAGACIDNCVGADCSDGNECTDDVCTSGGGGFTCTNPNNDANSCTTCGSSGCICTGGSCIAGCTVPPVQNALAIPMACRNSFNQAVSTFPIDLENVTTSGDCVESGSPVTFSGDATIALDTAFLDAAAATLCDLGTTLTQADVTVAQVRVDAISGVTASTSDLVELSPVPQTVVLDVTVTGICGAGGSVTVNSGVALPLGPFSVPTTPGASGDTLNLCSTGEVPLSITLANPATDTFVGVSVSGGAIQVVFQCNTSSTTAPAPGVTVSCTAPNPTGECAGLPAGNVGETPFPTSDCDFGDGFPGSCTTVPVSVPAVTVCPTYTVE